MKPNKLKHGSNVTRSLGSSHNLFYSELLELNPKRPHSESFRVCELRILIQGTSLKAVFVPSVSL